MIKWNNWTEMSKNGRRSKEFKGRTHAIITDLKTSRPNDEIIKTHG